MGMELFHLYEERHKSEQGPLCLAARGAVILAKVWQGITWGRRESYFCDEDEDGRPEDGGKGMTLREMFESRARDDESCHIGEWHLPIRPPAADITKNTRQSQLKA